MLVNINQLACTCSAGDGVDGFPRPPRPSLVKRFKCAPPPPPPQKDSCAPPPQQQKQHQHSSALQLGTQPCHNADARICSHVSQALSPCVKRSSARVASHTEPPPCTCGPSTTLCPQTHTLPRWLWPADVHAFRAGYCRPSSVYSRLPLVLTAAQAIMHTPASRSQARPNTTSSKRLCCAKPTCTTPARNTPVNSGQPPRRAAPTDGALPHLRLHRISGYYHILGTQARTPCVPEPYSGGGGNGDSDAGTYPPHPPRTSISPPQRPAPPLPHARALVGEMHVCMRV